jgi:hypothetical protein
VVRAEGLEPPRLSSPEPKSGASTNSATPAKGNFKTILAPQSGNGLARNGLTYRAPPGQAAKAASRAAAYITVKSCGILKIGRRGARSRAFGGAFSKRFE